MSCWGLIVAGGKGSRLGREKPKQYVTLVDRPLLLWSVAAFQQCTEIKGIVLVLDQEGLTSVPSLLTRYELCKVRQICAGGPTRLASVQAGLQALPDEAELVAIHDAARPLVSPALIRQVVAEAARHGAALPVVPVPDTVKLGQHGQVVQTLDRATLFLAQTPQVFRREIIFRAYATYETLEQVTATRSDHQDSTPVATDDAQLVENMGYPVQLVAGDPLNFKITIAPDLARAEQLLQQQGKSPAMSTVVPRTGFGYDVHRLVPGRALILGGMNLPSPLGLLGHSDADVLCHAIGDALLGAANLGDLGTHFPPTDPHYRGVSSLTLLEKIVCLVQTAGYQLGNLDAVLVCEQPHLAPHLPAMRSTLAAVLQTTDRQINLKATTTERLGFAGREEGIAAYATVLLFPVG